jgi:DNA-binding LytR/AlgR family response regulator
MNCIIIDDDKLSLKILEDFVRKTETLELIGTYDNAIGAINALQKENGIDLIFLDIEMPEMTGFDFMKTLNDPPQIIICSAKERYAINAFEYNVTDYLLKPVTYARFFKAVDKAFQQLQKRYQHLSSGDEIFIKKNASLVRIKYNDIIWVEALENYVIFNTNGEKYTVHYTMKSVENKLPPKKFVRVHRSFIVNVSMIESIEENVVYLRTSEGPKAIPIGKSYKDGLLNDLNTIAK